ncbi:MAG: tetratricopeptide repeat protein [Bacteroidales bacterium]
MNTLKYYILSGILLTSVLLQASELPPQTMIDSATSAYTKGHYEAAIYWYEKVIATGNESAALYYNLGNAWFKRNEMAPAIYYYEKALLLDPSDEDILFNLKVANSRIVDKIDVVPDLFFERWWKSLYTLFTGDTWAWLSLIFLALFLAALGWFLLSNRPGLKRTGFYSALLFLLMGVLSYTFASKNHYRQTHHTHGIIFEPSVTVKSSPDENSVDLFVLHEGTKVQLSDSLNSWVKIKIANGSVGWIPGNTLRRY